jgi:hypothetical protein
MIAERDGKKVVLRVEGKLPERVNPNDGAAIKRALKKLGATEADHAEAMLALEAADEPTTVAPFTVEAWDEKGSLKIEGQDDPPTDVLLGAMAEGKDFHRWHGKSRLCVLDVDRRPGFPEPDHLAPLRSIGPLPTVWWRSRSGGAHYVFECDAPGTGFGLTAEQKAGAFALCAPALRSPSVLRLELLASTRAVPAGQSVTRCVSRYGVADLPGALTSTGGADAVDPADVAAWLEERAMEPGGRYGHERCPFDPSPGSRGDPVVVHEDGVHCFRCAGVSGRGTSPWARLLRAGGPTVAPDPIVAAASARVHWSHAEFLLTAYAPTLGPSVARAAYSALLTLFDAETAPTCMGWGDDPKVVRSEGGWICWPTGRIAPLTTATTKTLPWSRSVLATEISARAGEERLTGYTPIRPTRCLVDRPEVRGDVVLVPLPKASDAPLEGEVPSLETALANLGACVGLAPQAVLAVQLLVLLGMRAQLVPATPGFLLVDGPTGAGKGFVTSLAAGILGGAPEPIDMDDPAELGRSMGTAVSQGASLLLLDEVGKVGSIWSRSSPLLRLSTRLSWRELHVGHVSCAMTAGVVMTGSTLPNGLTTMTEFQRRMARVHLPNAYPESDAWPERLKAWLGVADGESVLTTPEGRRWAEALRRWARAEALRPWVEHAVSLGATRLEEEEEAVAQQRCVDALHALWVEGSGRTGSGDRLVGWLKCWEGEAATVLSGWFTPENDLQRTALCGRLSTARTGSGARCRARHSGARIFVRFD